ncbi:MAG: transcriptional regulator [Mesorhizobium amorphae]|nr:MAG: transcriptional regulator [Mesorhizobium amorphae]
MRSSFTRRFHANEIFHCIRLEPQISQRDIIEKTGFDKSTVSSVINSFSVMGLVMRAPKQSENRPGRPSEGLAISPQSGLLVGVQVDLGETVFVASGLDGQPVAQHRMEFDGKVGSLAAHATAGIETVRAASGRDAPLLGIGVSLPGLIDRDGVLLHAPVLGWRDVPVLDLLRREIASPIYVGNDGKAAATAEHLFGACVGIKDFIYLFSGSGVGGALFLDGETYLGMNGLAGELGHLKVVPQGRICSCGSAGCLSAYLSTPGLAREIGAASGRPVASLGEIIERAETGDAITLAVLEQAGGILGSAVASLINTFNPPVMAFGGDMARAERFIRPALERGVARLAHPRMAEATRFVFSEISVHQPYLGGIALALDGVTGLEGEGVFP